MGKAAVMRSWPRRWIGPVLYAVIVTAALSGIAVACANAEDIALSLVNPKGRVDIPASALGDVKASATYAFRDAETREVREFPDAHVSVCFSEDVQKRICELTRQLVGQPMEIVIDCATISKPIVREPLCAHPCFQVSANDIAEATALAQRIRHGSSRTCAPSS